MKYTETKLKGAFVVDIEKREDERGFFARFFCEKEFKDQGLNSSWLQANNSLSKSVGTLRGLHFQRHPCSEVKLVRCLKGAIWDVIVDLRANSPTYGSWVGETLSDTNRSMMYVPKGFAHGFISLEPDSEILYLVSDYYSPEAEETLLWSDVDVGIDWPIEPVVISTKDANAKTFKELKNLQHFSGGG
jgi:dTDP-4-dehydrorhamnose 3,5-epimerase